TKQERAIQLEILKQHLQNGVIVLIVIIPDLQSGTPVAGRRSNRVLSGQMISAANSAGGREARAYVEKLLAAANEADLKARLQVPTKLPPVTMVSLSSVTLEATRADELLPLSALVPLIL